MNQIVWIAIGGAIGAVFRYLIGMGMTQFFPGNFPNGTLLVNILGCFFIGVVFAAFQQHNNFEGFLRPFLVIGILGGFTTFSSFSMETIVLFQNQEGMKAMCYILLSNVLGLSASWAGYKMFVA